MAFAHTRWPQQDHVAALLDEAQRGEFSEHLAIQRRLEVQIELGERLVNRVARKAQPSAQPPRPRCIRFDRHQAFQHLRRRCLLARATVELVGKMLCGGAHLEVRKMFTQALVRAGVRAAGTRAHRATS